MIGKTISHYHITDKLGEGGMGVVYKAEDIKLHRTVALKFLSPVLSCDNEAKQRFIREAEAASALEHPNICTIHEIDETPEGQLFIVMAYYPGESLRQNISSGPLPSCTAVDIAIQAAQGLSRAHKHGIIHRDIKPANIMLTEDGMVKIVDFGLAKLSGSSDITKTGSTLGTTAYMSPEQARGEQTDCRTDIWSLGVVLYEMLMGELPFKGELEQALMYMIISADPKPMGKNNIPPDLINVVTRAMKKDPEERYSSASDMVEDLQKYKERIRTEEYAGFNFKQLLYLVKKPKSALYISAVIILLAAAVYFYADRRAKLNHAREVLLPRITAMVQENDIWRNLITPYRLAEEAEKILGDDPELAALFSECSMRINITTEPPGAAVYMKEYVKPDNEWTYLGETPLQNVRVPIGIFRWKFEKEGYDTVYAAASTWDKILEKGGYNISRTLDKQGTLPQDMVRVPATQTDYGIVDDFFIDRFEVKNRNYKGFIDKGGYSKKEYWKYPFVVDGKEIIWEEGIRLLVDQTGRPGPSTWQAGEYPEGQADYPVSGISWYEAAAYAEYAGKSLPSNSHWNIARGLYTPMIRTYQLGGFAVLAEFSNFSTKGTLPAGALNGVTAYGAYDMAGNVREWCWNETSYGRLIRGGAWGGNTYDFGRAQQAPPMDRSLKNGFRCVIYPDPDKVNPEVFKPFIIRELVDFRKIQPVDENVFRFYKEQFSYDKLNLDPRNESKQKNSEGWTLEKVSYNAAYGNERIPAYLFIPGNSRPPYQTVIYFPGSAGINMRSSEGISEYYEFSLFLSFLVKNGRAVLFPVYKGIFERGDTTTAAERIASNTYAYSEFIIQLVKDFRRSVDYLETRNDIDKGNLAYYGMSWGGMLGAIIPAVEDRLKTAVLIAGRLSQYGRPEVNAFNYITRVKLPVIMLNGRYDAAIDHGIRPMYDLLGTPAKDKRLIVYDTDHIPPRNEFIRETLNWLDKYLGPVTKF